MVEESEFFFFEDSIQRSKLRFVQNYGTVGTRVKHELLEDWVTRKSMLVTDRAIAGSNLVYTSEAVISRLSSKFYEQGYWCPRCQHHWGICLQQTATPVAVHALFVIERAFAAFPSALLQLHLRFCCQQSRVMALAAETDQLIWFNRQDCCYHHPMNLVIVSNLLDKSWELLPYAIQYIIVIPTIRSKLLIACGRP